ncbi:MAG: ABC transporter ATP-binding protein [Patescibacteria group bacterium]
MELIRTEKLEKTYIDEDVRTRAFFDVNLKINEGEFVSIVGPSGSGKSTLMQVLGYLDRPTGGKYFFEGKELKTYSDDELAHIRNEKIGFVFQAFNLLPRLSVLENVALPLMYRGIPIKERNKKARELIHLVELDDRIDFRTSKLSGGQKQRVAIARALVNNPKIIFADEPTGNLDSKSGGIILEFLQKLNEQGHTIVVVTHESYVAHAGERILHIVDGRIDKDERVEKRRIVKEEGFSK